MSPLLVHLADLFSGQQSIRRRQCYQPTFTTQIADLEPRLLLTVGADGWTELVPSADSRMVYVSSSTGSDANNGLSPEHPLQTIRFARSKLRNGFADWLLLKNGDVFREGTISLELRGRSAAEPLVITGYGSGARPLLRETALSYYWNAGFPAGFSLDYLTVVGLEFQGDYEHNPAAGANNTAILLSGPMNGIVLENNIVTGYASGVNAQIKSYSEDAVETLTFRRNIVADNSDFGLLASEGNNVLLQGNVFDRNGWGGAGPTILKHNVYLKQVNNVILQDNIFARGGNFGTKLSSDHPGGFTNFVVENNLYYNNGISLDHSAGSTGDVQTTFTHEDGSIVRNVFTESGRTFSNGVVQDLVGWILNTRNVSWTENLFVHKPPVNTGVILNWGQHHENITVKDSVVYNWDLRPDLPDSAYLDYKADEVINGYTSLNNEIDLPAQSYVDPSRTVGSYYASIGGTNDAVAFLTAARNMSKNNWNAAYTADAVNDYIRAGFARVLATPVFTTPGNSTTSSPLQTVSWNTINGADAYEVWYSNLTTGQSSAFMAAAASASYTPSTALPIGQYQIWVRATQNGGPSSPWSTPIILRVNAAPVLNSLPSNGVSARPQLSWNPLPGAVKYEVWGDNVTTGATKVVSANNVTQTTFTPASDLGFSLYRFWVRGIDAKGVYSQWSLAQDYSRLNLTSVIQPVLSNGIDARPTITWAAVQGAVRYELWANNLTDGTIAVINNASIIGTSFTPAVPLSFATYRLWVRAFDSISRVTPWSNPLDVATVPTLLSPVQPTFERRPTFTWATSAIAVSYDLWINIANAVTTQTALTGTSWTPTSDLPIGDMSWWVRPRGADGVPGPWSKKGESSIGGRSSVLTAGVPGNDPGRIGVFTWKAVTGAGRYILQVDLVGVGTVVRQDNLTNTSFTTSAPLAAGQYRAWIKAIDGSDNVTGIWSTAFSFTVVGVQAEELNSPAVPQFATRQLESELFDEPLDAMSQLVVSDGASVSQQVIRPNAVPADRETDRHSDIETEWLDDGMHSKMSGDALMSELDADLIDMVMSESHALTSEL